MQHRGCCGLTHDDPLVAIQLLLRWLLGAHGVWLPRRSWALAAQRAVAVTPCWNWRLCTQRRVLMCHLALVDLPESLCDIRPPVQVVEDGVHVWRSLLGCRSRARWRRWAWWWGRTGWRRNASRWRRRRRRRWDGAGSRARGRAGHLLGRFFRVDAVAVPGDTAGVVLLRVLGQSLE